MEDRKLRIVIVGAGIAGLAATRILREHHDITVFERATPGNATGGQGVCFFPATVKILKSMGYDEDRGYPCRVTFFRHYDRHGNPTSTIQLDYSKKYGEDIWSQLRSDGRDELFRLATAPVHEVGIPDANGSVKMVYDTAVVDVDTDNAIVTLSDGSSMQGDVVISKCKTDMIRVISSCGWHSFQATPEGPGARSKVQSPKIGLTIFRVAVPIENARNVLGDDLPHWMRPDKDGMGCITYFQSQDESNRLVVTYPLRRFQWIHISLHLPTGAGHGDAESESWHADAGGAEIIDAFHDFDENILKLVKAGTQIKVWDMQDLDPIPLWNKGRIILIGDAAHAMTPMQGQGGNMAIEDGEAFRLFAPNTSPDKVPEILRQIDSVRRPRTTKILWTTRDTRPNTTMEDRIERMDFANNYFGIDHALKQIAT